MDKIDKIIQFWFEGLTDDVLIEKKNPIVKKWFVKDAKFDQEIRMRFEEDIQKAARGEYNSWEDSPQGVLALILLFDQFPRNIYRGLPEAYAFDLKALALSLQAIHREDDLKLPLIQRIFIYMPLEHDENIKVQMKSIQCFKNIVKLAQQKSPQNVSYFEYNLTYALKHEAIVQEFGRFPHRNAILKRASTPQEVTFLKKPNSSF